MTLYAFFHDYFTRLKCKIYKKCCNDHHTRPGHTFAIVTTISKYVLDLQRVLSDVIKNIYCKILKLFQSTKFYKIYKINLSKFGFSMTFSMTYWIPWLFHDQSFSMTYPWPWEPWNAKKRMNAGHRKYWISNMVYSYVTTDSIRMNENDTTVHEVIIYPFNIHHPRTPWSTSIYIFYLYPYETQSQNHWKTSTTRNPLQTLDPHITLLMSSNFIANIVQYHYQSRTMIFSSTRMRSEHSHTILSSGNPDLYKINEKQFQTHLNQKYQQGTV